MPVADWLRMRAAAVGREERYRCFSLNTLLCTEPSECTNTQRHSQKEIHVSCP